MAKAILEEKLAKLKTKNAKLQNQLQGSQEDLPIAQHNYTTISSKVMGLKKQVKATEDKLRETTKCEAASREVIVLEAKQ